MKISKTLIAAMAVAFIGVAGVGSMGVASAVTNSVDTPSGGISDLVNKIADKFNLDKNEVEKVVEEDRAERKAEKEQRVADKLQELVKDGKLSEEQKDMLLAKRAELQAARESIKEDLKDKTDEERHQYMKEQREKLMQWAEDNDISTKYLHFVMGYGRHISPSVRDAMRDNFEVKPLEDN